MERFVDTHCHILSGVDDGAQTVEEMQQMPRARSGRSLRPPEKRRRRSAANSGSISGRKCISDRTSRTC